MLEKESMELTRSFCAECFSNDRGKIYECSLDFRSFSNPGNQAYFVTVCSREQIPRYENLS